MAERPVPADAEARLGVRGLPDSMIRAQRNMCRDPGFREGWCLNANSAPPPSLLCPVAAVREGGGGRGLNTNSATPLSPVPCGRRAVGAGGGGAGRAGRRGGRGVRGPAGLRHGSYAVCADGWKARMG